MRLVASTLVTTALVACGSPPAVEASARAPVPAAPTTPPPVPRPAVDELASKIDAILAPVTSEGAPGCEVGVYHAGEIAFAKGYGTANLEWNGAMTPDTPIYLASIAKQFTAASVVLLANDGKLAFDDDVRKYVPELPDYGTVVTLDELLHHTSGVRDYGLLLDLSGHQGDDFVSSDDVVQLLARQKHLNFTPGSEYLYSNSGYVLLGRVVERASGQSLASFEKARLFDPLGMTRTSLKDDYTRVVPGRANGYAKGRDGVFHVAMGHSQITGQGNVLSTVRDLARWDANFYEPKVGGQALVDGLRAQGVLTGGLKVAYARGLQEDVDPASGLPRESHDGRLDGYRASVVRYPTARTTIAVLCNDGAIDAHDLGVQIARVALPDVARSEPRAGEPGPSTAPRTGDHAEPPKVPTPTELRDFAGRYGSDEVLRDSEYLVKDGGLYVHVWGSPAVSGPMQAVAPDQFALAGVTTSFERVRGKVVAVTISNERTRGVRLVRR